MRYKTKIFALILSAFLILPNFSPALSWGDEIQEDEFLSGLKLGIPQGFDQILEDLGADKSELRYSVQTMNVMRQKKTPPSVSLNFNPKNPVPGERVSATAVPLYFMNDVEDMYFTWFLKSADCGTNSNNDEECDHNDDGDIDIEDYKIKAARIIASSNFEWEAEEAYDTHTDSDGYQARQGGDDQGGKNNFCFIHDIESGDEYEIGCGHLFADSPGHQTGDGSFGSDEEEFWRTDPNADDTAGTGNGDEANITGLGINTFSWNYEEGDEVGVVVEGVSIEPTHYEDSSYRTMWAATNSLCSEDLSIDIDYPKTNNRTVSETESFDGNVPPNRLMTTVTERTTESIESRAANIANITTITVTTTTVRNADTGVQISQTSTTSTSHESEDISEDITIDDVSDASDLNDCLYASLIAPSEGGGAAERLDVSLSYFPENALNDTATGSLDGDILTIHSTLLNANDPKFTHYSWQVYQSDKINPDSWGSAIMKEKLPDSSRSDGLNLSSYKFRLNLDDQNGRYLKVKLNVKENVGSGKIRKGYAEIIIPFQSSSEKIKTYSANISESLDFSLSGIERCLAESEINICPVAKNEILGVKFAGSGYSDYSWTIDGAPLSDNEKIMLGSTAFFPVIKNIGERITIGLSAASIETGNKISLSRIFEVAEPEIKISSADDTICGPVLLGNYIDLDGKAWPDFSEANFWSLEGEEIKLKAEAIGFSEIPQNFIWSVDGYAAASNEDGTLSLPPKLLGEEYTVAASTIYSPGNLTKKALNEYWNIGYSQFYERPISDTIHIEMIPSAETTAQMKDKKIVAALFTSLPSYLAFLLRIALTALIILVGSTLLMSFFPNLKNEE
jgi:hypothetical protein